tara:strand:- start:464 stop:2389 length:1926 start_codon:yes stop_codon:yes gene_type:complete
MELQQAQRLVEAIRALSGIDDRSPAEEDALARAKAARPQEVIDSFGASYRGLAQGATLRGGDELVAAVQGVAPGGMNYKEALAAQREANKLAQQADPEAYSRGETAGMVGTSSLGFAAPSLAGARGLGALGQMFIGGSEGAALTAAPDFLGGEGGFMQRASEVQPLPTAIGAGLGAVAPVAGLVAGGVTRAAQNINRGTGGFGSRATQVAARGLNRTMQSGEDIEAYLASLGDNAILADVPGGPMSQAMGLAAQQGTGGTIVNRAIADRAAGSGARIEGAVSDVAGAPNAAFRERMNIAEQKKGVFGPEYEIALEYDSPISTNSIVDGVIAPALPDAVGETATRLNRYKRILTTGDDEGMSARRLHNTRVIISDDINNAKKQNKGGLARSLVPLLNAVDDKLDSIPGYKGARSGYADVSAMERQIDAGRQALVGGRNTISPDELASNFDKLNDAQKDAFRTGAREYIAALMGTARNAPAAAWGELSTGFNDKKLRILFGEEDAGRIMQTLRGEKSFSETRGIVSQGSMTEMRRQAESDLGPVREVDTGRRRGPVMRIKDTLDDSVNAAIDSVLYGSRRSNANADLGKILSLQGSERDRAVSALMGEAMRQRSNTRAQGVVKLLTEMGFGASVPAITSEEPR